MVVDRASRGRTVSVLPSPGRGLLRWFGIPNGRTQLAERLGCKLPFSLAGEPVLRGHAPPCDRSPQEPVRDFRQVPGLGDRKRPVALSHEVLGGWARVGRTGVGVDIHISTHPLPVHDLQQEVLVGRHLHPNALGLFFRSHDFRASERGSLADSFCNPRERIAGPSTTYGCLG